MPKIAISAILILAVIFAILFGAWDHLDRAGWIPHRQVTATYIGQSVQKSPRAIRNVLPVVASPTRKSI